MIKLMQVVSLIIMFSGVAMSSTALIICGFLAANIWACTEIITKKIELHGVFK